MGDRIPFQRARRSRRVLVALLMLGVSGATLFAATLTGAAVRAFTDYVDRARQTFLSRVNQPIGGTDAERAALRREELIVRPGGGDGIESKPDSLIHHWRGAVFIPRTTLDDALSVSRRYRDYPSVFKPVVAAEVLSEKGDVLQVQFRMRQSAGGITGTIDVWSNIRYTRIDPARALVISSSDTIREVRDAGKPSEHYAALGSDNGYLWRAAAFTRFVEADGGVYMEMETIGLSRQFPMLMGWIIEPIARHIGRASVETSMQEFRRAVLMRKAD